jgi:hypothetical protein
MNPESPCGKQQTGQDVEHQKLLPQPFPKGKSVPILIASGLPRGNSASLVILLSSPASFMPQIPYMSVSLAIQCFKETF